MYYPEEIVKAIGNFLHGTASAEDIQIVNAWYYSFNDEEIVIPADMADLRQQVKERIRARLYESLPELHRPPATIKKMNRRWITIAAAVLLIAIGASIWRGTLPTHRQQELAQTDSIPLIQDVSAPVSAIALLTLADGREVKLDSPFSGLVARQGDAQIVKNANGEIVYSSAYSGNSTLYNTVTTPKGSKVVNLTLSDGTQVWLNAESSLRFPVSHAHGEEKVFITGEAYFEVSKNPHRHFIVCAGTTTTEVLGTHFNVNAYTENDLVRVTLLEGRIQVANADTKGIVVPGQQANLPQHGKLNIHRDADLEEVMAWKNGLFKFRQEELQSIMKKIERWYNVDIRYVGEIKRLRFGGVIPRTENVSSVLDLLQMTGVVQFTIEPSSNGNAGKIIVRCS